MTAKDDRRTRGSTSSTTEWREMAPAVAVLGVVLGVLVLTAILHVPSNGETVVARPAGGRIDDSASVGASESDIDHLGGTENPGSEPASASGPEASPPAGGGTGLDERVRRDTRRLGERGEAWTLQILVACDAGNVESILERLGRSDRAYVLPATIDGRACYRVCWDTFASHARAVGPNDLPKDVLHDLGRPTPKEVSALTR
jgi:hypothetical protein